MFTNWNRTLTGPHITISSKSPAPWHPGGSPPLGRDASQSFRRASWPRRWKDVEGRWKAGVMTRPGTIHYMTVGYLYEIYIPNKLYAEHCWTTLFCSPEMMAFEDDSLYQSLFQRLRAVRSLQFTPNLSSTHLVIPVNLATINDECNGDTDKHTHTHTTTHNKNTHTTKKTHKKQRAQFRPNNVTVNMFWGI